MTSFLKNIFLFNKLLLLFIFATVSISAYSQHISENKNPSKIYAKYCLKFNNYYAGLNEFERLLEAKPNDNYYLWGVAYCHLNLNIDKSKAIPFFEELLSRHNADQAALYDLGNTYLQTNNIDKAEEIFLRYLKLGIKDDHIITAKRQLEYIANAREAFNNPINVKITNAGEYINSEYPEFNPFIDANEEFIIFSQQSPLSSHKQRHDDGYFPSNIYYSIYKAGKWKRTKRFSTIVNTQDIETNGFLSKDASYFYIYREDLVGKNKQHFLSSKQGRSFKKPHEISIASIEMRDVRSIAISNNRKWLIFSAPSANSDRNDLDLFYSKLGPTGRWSKPQSFDTTINTIYDESFPYFPPNDAVFVFASKGHNSIGGYDLFFSEITIDSIPHISNIKNIGYPVNTTMDNKTISINNSGRYAYISSLREGGYGDLDIYRIVFEDQKPLLTVIHGHIFNEDSIKISDLVKAENILIDSKNINAKRKYNRLLRKRKDSTAAKRYYAKNIIPYQKLQIKIAVINKETNKAVGNFIVKENTGAYNIVLSPGKYNVIFSKDGYFDKTIESIIIEDYDLRERNIEMDIFMKNK